MSKILAVGDIHAHWGELNNLIIREKPDIILQCGDFGYWENISFYSVKHIEPRDTKIYFCAGNHEDWDLLDNLKDHQITPNIRYMKAGSTFKLPDGRNILFMGGADSIDKEMRTPGFDWFPQEVITQSDMKNLPDEKIDMVISHTCPNEFEMTGTFGGFDARSTDPSRHYLSLILKKYKPSAWCFGHWHKFKESQYKDGKYKCSWMCLNESKGQNWWVEI